MKQNRLKSRHTYFEIPRSLWNVFLRPVIPSHMRKPQTADRAVTTGTLENRGHFVKTDKNDDIVLLSWIYYPLSTMLDVVPPGSSIWR